MPKPVYILCSESGAEDKSTGLAIHFKVIDRILISNPIPEKPEGVLLVRPLPIHIAAVWMRSEAEDQAGEFESQVRIFLPPDGKEWIPVPTSTFRFEKPRYRCIVNLDGLLLNGAGELLIESRIRKVGGEQWLSQSYPIEVVVPG